MATDHETGRTGQCRLCGKPIADNPPRYDVDDECRDCERELNRQWMIGLAEMFDDDNSWMRVDLA